jgi:hypothetical protein
LDVTCLLAPSSSFFLHHGYLVYLFSSISSFSLLTRPLKKPLLMFHLFSHPLCPQQTILLWAKYSLRSSPWSYFFTEGLVPVLSAPVSTFLHTWLTLLHWQWRQQFLPTHWHLFTGLHSVRSQKNTIFMVTAVRTSYLMYYCQSWHKCY